MIHLTIIAILKVLSPNIVKFRSTRKQDFNRGIWRENRTQSLLLLLLFSHQVTSNSASFYVPHHSQNLPKFMSVKLVMPSTVLSSFCRALLLPSVFPSIRVFSNESALCIRWLKYWSFSFSINPSNEYSGWISFRMDWLDLLAVKGTLKSILQYHNLKAAILWGSAFFIVQLSYPCMTTGKTTALTRWTFVDKVMSVLFNMLSRLLITFLPRRKHLLISWLQLPSAVILERK